MSVIIGNKQDRTIDGALRTLTGASTSLTPGAALGLLAEHAAGAKEAANRAKAVKGLTSALAEHPDAQVRVGAAAALGAVDTRAAIRALRTAVDTTDDGEVLGAASLALARSGSKADAKRLLDGSRRIQWEPGQRRAAAAARLLAYRNRTGLGSESDRSSMERDILSLPARPTKITPMDVADVVSRVRVRAVEANLVPPAAKAVGAFSCGPRQHIVMAPTTKQHVSELAKAPAIAATLMGINESTGTAFVRWLVLTRPATAEDGPDRGGDGDLVVTVTRSTGEVGFIGRGHVEGDSLEVTVAAVAAPGAGAAELTGTLSAGDAVITGRSDDQTTVARNHPTPDVAR